MMMHGLANLKLYFRKNVKNALI